MNYRIWFDDKEKIVRVKIEGRFGSEDNREFIRKIEDEFTGKDHHVVVIDVTEGRFVMPGRENREKMVGRIKQLDFERIAFVGASPLVKMMMKIIAMIMNVIRAAIVPCQNVRRGIPQKSSSWSLDSCLFSCSEMRWMSSTFRFSANSPDGLSRIDAIFRANSVAERISSSEDSGTPSPRPSSIRSRFSSSSLSCSLLSFILHS